MPPTASKRKTLSTSFDLLLICTWVSFQSGTHARHPVIVVARCPFKDGIGEPVSWLIVLKKKSITRLQVRTRIFCF